MRTICVSLRYKVDKLPVESKAIYCGWHGRSITFANFFRKRGWWVIISHSSDGEIQRRIFERFGYQIIRGSTGRGGERALVEAIRVLRDGGTMAMTPDGPRGPSGVVQGGVMKMAEKSGAALVPVGISARPRVLVKSWDRYMIPSPLARCVIMFGEPLYVPDKASKEQVEEVRLKLESEIHRVQAEAERRLGFSGTE